MTTRPFAIAILLLLCACYNAPDNAAQQTATAHAAASLPSFKWLIGKWQHREGGKISFESWAQLNDTTMTGVSGTITGTDTVVEETMLLKQTQSGIAYIPTVKNQNDGKQVVFRLTSNTAKDYVFENPAHDFPQIISYTNKSVNSLVAKISGNMNGKHKEISFPMERID